MNGINTFIFDMGNVLIDYNPFRIMEEIVGDWEAIPEIMAATVFSPLWIELDKGAVSQEDAVKTMVRQAPQHQEKIQAVMERWDETLLPIPGMLELVSQLKAQGYGLHLLSNASLRFYQYQNRFPVMKMMDSVHISASMRLIKPDPKIYQRVMEEQGLQPEACLFIDDLKDNIQGAQACGIHGYQFSTPDAFSDFLRRNKFLP